MGMATEAIRISNPLIGPEEQAAVAAVLSSGNLVQGAQVADFEQAFAGMLGVPHAVAVSSGTAALQLGLQSLGIGPGDEVITTPFSFIATANAILYTGATPVFADIDPITANLDPAEVEKKITKKTKAVVAVHLYGLPCEMEQLQAICKKNNILLIEDCAQSCGASVGGRKTGSFGLGCFSFYATKNLCTGEGGMVTTHDSGVAEQCRILRSQGQSGQYNHVRLGFNFRMTEMQAALGVVQLKKLGAMNSKRKENAAFLSENLTGLPFIRLPAIPAGVTHAWHQYTIRTPYRDRLQQHLAALGIDARVYYPKVIYQQPVYQQLGYRYDCPHAEQAAAEVLSLPVHPWLSSADLGRIVSAIRGFKP